MNKFINVPGRLHSFETGNVVVGANEVYDDILGLKQDVINARISALIENGTAGGVQIVDALPTTDINDSLLYILRSKKYSTAGGWKLGDELPMKLSSGDWGLGNSLPIVLSSAEYTYTLYIHQDGAWILISNTETSTTPSSGQDNNIPQVIITQEEYDNLPEVEPNTLYFII